MLFTLIPHSMMITAQRGELAQYNTLSWALRHFAHMLNLLCAPCIPQELPEGIYPRGCCSPGVHRSLIGSAPCEGWAFGYAGLTGDMEFMRDANLQIASGRYYACRSCCPKCRASTVDPALDCYNVKDDAGWRDTLITTEGYLADTPLDALPPLHEVHGWAYELNLDDCLHILFLGVVQDIVASCLVVLCLRGFYGPGNISEQLRKCHREAVRFAAGRMVIPDFTRASMKLEEAGNYPEIGGKASLAKLLLRFAASEAELFAIAHPESEEARLCHAATHSLQDAVETMDKNGEVFDAAAVEQCASSLDAYQKAYMDLVDGARTAEEALWKLRPKFHMVGHISLFVRDTSWNPRFWACWMDEDFMAKCRSLCQRVRYRGTTVSRHALQRYIWKWADTSKSAGPRSADAADSS